MDGASLSAFALIPVSPPGWRLAGTADFDGDGVPDLVFQNTASGAATVWFMGGSDGNTLVAFSLLTLGFGPDWRIAAIGDFDHHDGPDIVWQNETSRASTVWYMSTGNRNPTLLSWLPLANTPSYHLVAVGKFGGQNSGPDLVWQLDSAPRLTMWFMTGATGTTLDSWGFVPLSNAVDSTGGWQVVGARDVLGRGRDQILWYGDNSRFGTIWDMSGVTTNSIALLQGGASYPGWHLIAR